MKRVVAISLAVFITCSGLKSETQDSVYTIEASLTIAPTITLFEQTRFPGADDNLIVGYSVTGRLMWHPARLLALGVMSGYSLLAFEEIESSQTEGEKTPTASLTAVPVQAIVSMQWTGLELGIGMGPYFLTGTIDDGAIARGTRMELGLLGFSSYRWELSTNVFLAAELRAVYMSFRRVLTIMPSLTIRYDLFHY